MTEVAAIVARADVRVEVAVLFARRGHAVADVDGKRALAVVAGPRAMDVVGVDGAVAVVVVAVAAVEFHALTRNLDAFAAARTGRATGARTSGVRATLRRADGAL